VLALVMANMNSDSAKDLTVKLANKLALPETASVPAPPAPIATAAAAPAATPAIPVANAPAAAPEKQAPPNG